MTDRNQGRLARRELRRTAEELTHAQLALVEQYERNVALEAELTHTQLALVEIYESILGGESDG